MRHGSVFTGIGGFDIAAKWMGWDIVFCVEIDKFCQKVLKKNFPEAKIFSDIKNFNGHEYNGTIDIISGGDPCQPHSIAGNRGGESDPRFLWKEYRRIYNEIAPGALVNENVIGSISNGVLDKKISDLEADGYACWPPLIIPAGSIGALHRRDRVFLVAYSVRQRRQKFNAAAISKKETERVIWNDPLNITQSWSDARNANKSAIIRMADGLSGGLYRNQRIKALGNSVMPQLAYQIFKAISKIEY